MPAASTRITRAGYWPDDAALVGAIIFASTVTTAYRGRRRQLVSSSRESEVGVAPTSEPSHSVMSGPAAIAATVGTFVVIVAALLLTLGRGGNTTESLTATTVVAAPTTVSLTTAPPSTPAGPRPVGADPAGIARATVFLSPLMADGSSCWSGSGTIIDPTGMILTNSHVVASEPDCKWDTMGVSLTGRTDSPAEPTYLAEVAGFDPLLDLATLRIVSDVDGNPVSPTDLPFVAVGDSDTVEVGDSLTMFGYPTIGGKTISVTTGIVSGFSREASIEDRRAWIKTDATISGGNSGGGAIDDTGRLVGIPTTAGIRGELTADCRVLEDTNGDGVVDNTDPCIPIGGFLNGLRPVNLADAVIAAVHAGETADPTVGYSPVDVTNSASAGTTQFGPDVTSDDTLTEVVSTLPASARQICAFWEYQGMQDGVSYDTIWLFDGKVIEGSSSFSSTWSGGGSGTWWACATNTDGIGTGSMEFEFFVEGRLLASNGIYVGDGHSPTMFRVNNRSDTEICFVFATPSVAADWGDDELSSDGTLPPGRWIELPVTTGDWDIMLQDCDQNTLQTYSQVSISAGTEIDYPTPIG